MKVFHFLSYEILNELWFIVTYFQLVFHLFPLVSFSKTRLFSLLVSCCSYYPTTHFISSFHSPVFHLCPLPLVSSLNFFLCFVSQLLPLSFGPVSSLFFYLFCSFGTCHFACFSCLSTTLRLRICHHIFLTKLRTLEISSENSNAPRRRKIGLWTAW